MKIAKQLVLLFFAALGFYYVLQDILIWIDPGHVKTNDGYFSAISLTALYGVIKFLQQRDKPLEAKQTEAPN